VSTRTLAEQPVLASGESSTNCETTETATAAAEQAKLAFAFLWLFTFVGFGRPQDLFPGLNALHLTLASAVLGLVAYVGALLIGRARLLWSTNVLLVLLLTGWFMVGIPFAYYRGGSFEVFTQTWLRTLIFFFLLTQTLTTVSRVKKIIWTVLLSELIASLASIFFQGKVGLLEGDRLSGVNQGLLGWNFLGISFSVTLPFLAALYLSAISATTRILLAVALGSTMWTVILTASRGGFFGCIVSVVLTWWFVLRRSPRGRLLAVLIPIGLAVVLLKAPDVFWSRLQTIWSSSSGAETYSAQSEGSSHLEGKLDAQSAEESTRGRQLLLENSLKYTAQFPFFGLGMGGFPLYNGRVLRRSDAWLGTHNTFTQLSSEAGIPALFLFLCLLFTMLGQMKKLGDQCASNQNKFELGLLAAATFASTLTFAFQGFFAHIAYEYLFYYLAGIAAGLCAIAQHDSSEDEPSQVSADGVAEYR